MYIAYFIDHSFCDLPYQSREPVKLMETFSTKKEAWNKIGQILLIDYGYMEIIWDYIVNDIDTEMEQKLATYIDGFPEFIKKEGDNRKNIKEGQLTGLFMRKIMDSPGFMTYLKIKNDEDKEIDCIFGVKEV